MNQVDVVITRYYTKKNIKLRNMKDNISKKAKKVNENQTFFSSFSDFFFKIKVSVKRTVF